MTQILNRIKIHHYLIIFLIIILIYTPLVNTLSYLNIVTKKSSDTLLMENNILKMQNDNLLKELYELNKLESYAKYDYSLTRLSYRELYNSDEIIILGGKDKKYKEGSAVINELGLVGIISNVYENTSKVKLLTDINNFSIKINNTYGSIDSYKDNIFKVTNISNYDEIHLNDEVYTSSLGNIHESLYIGLVIDIKEKLKNKEIYIKSNVDFNNLTYLYVIR